MWGNTMSEIENANACARGEELVAYLYGEANASEARDFQSHLKGCHACRAELAAFGSVREGIQTWREEALHPATVPAMQAQTLAEAARLTAEPKRSALAALREFLTLSPMWLRGATAFTTLLLVALLIITALHFFKRADAPVAKQQQPSAPAPKVEERGNESAPARQEETAESKALPDNPAPVAINHKAERRTGTRQRNLSAKAKTEPGTPSLSNEEQRQLGDLLIAEREHEENVPRLYDLLSDSN
jgi:hypothetical protein